MPDLPPDEASREDRVDAVVASYLEAIEQGEGVDPHAHIDEHPDFAAELARFFDDRAEFQRAAGDLSPKVRRTHDPATLTDTPPPDPSQTTWIYEEPILDGTPRPTNRFGDYELLEEIARGGMGVVYKARQIKLNRVVALKMILAGQLASAEDVKRFRIEAEAAAQLDHPGIVPIFEVGEHHGQHYFSMGYVEGCSLAARVAEGPLPPREAAELVKAVAEAVHYAHEKGVIHRDLKPGNILLAQGRVVSGGVVSGKDSDAIQTGGSRPPPATSQTGGSRPPLAHMIPKITDFGLAKRVEGDSSVTDTSQILGTPSYMPPEQAEGGAVGRASDVYALGAILNCLLTGRPPFQAATPLETLLQVVEQEPAPPRQLNPALPLDLDTIVLKCLEKVPERRYATAHDLADELDRFLEGRPIHARRIGRAERGWRWCKRNPAVASLTSVAALLLLSVTVVSSVAYFREAALRNTVEIKTGELAASLERETRISQSERKAKEDALEAQGRERGAKEEERVAKEAAQNRLAQIAKGNDILESIFKNLDPLEEEKQGKSLRELLGKRLDKATEELEGEAVGDALAVAKLQRTLGVAQYALGHAEQAIALLTKALGTITVELGPEHRDTLNTMNYLAMAYTGAGKRDQALPLLAETLELAKAQLGPEDWLTLSVMDNLAAAYQHAGKLPKAIELFEQVRDIEFKNLGADHGDTLDTLTRLAGAYLDAGKPEQALPLFEETLKRSKAALGPGHSLTLRAMNDLATAYQQTPGKLGPAIALLEEVLRLRKGLLGLEDPNTLQAMNNLATAYKDAGRLAEALPLFEQTLELMRANLGTDNRLTLLTMNNLAAAYWADHKLDLSIPLFEEALKLKRLKLGPDDESTLGALANLGVNYRDAGRLQKGIACLEEALEGLKKLPSASAERLSWVPGALTQAYDLAAQFAKAEPILRQRLADDTRRFGADGPQTAETMGDLGLNLLKQQRWADAEPILRECLGIRSRKEPDAWTTFSTESLLGMALLGQQKYAEAETLSLSGYEGMKARENTIPPEAKIRVTRTVQRLVVLYTATGQQEKADEWRAKLPAESPHPEVPRTEVSDPMKAVSDLALGDQQAARGEHQAALASYTRALATIEQIASKDPNGGAIQDLLYRAYNSIGNLQHRMGDNQAALASHNKALPIAERRVRDDPAKTEYQTYLGGTYCNLGNAENMAGHVDEALRWYDRAAEALQAILKREPEHASTRLFLRNTCWGRAMALGRLSRHAEACESWQEAVELDAEKRADLRSAYAESLSELAWSLAARPETELRDPPRAVELAKRSIELNPNTTVAFNTLGVAQYRAGNWQAAVEALDQSVKLRAGGDAFDWLFLAMSHQRLGNQDEARKWYDQAVEWTEKQTAPNDELVRFRREAAEVLDGTNGRQAGGEDRE